MYFLRGVECLHYPLDYPDPYGAFYGYDTVREAGWYASGTKRGLKELLYGVNLLAKALIHMHAPRVIGIQRFSIFLYHCHVNDEWRQFLDILDTCIRCRWVYLVPEKQEDRILLRKLCEQTLKFENHFLVCYRTYLLSLLNSKDQDSRDFAIKQLEKVLYPDEKHLNHPR